MVTYGNRPDDVVTDSLGNAISGATITLHLNQADANNAASAVGSVVTDAGGRWRFDWEDTELWARIGYGASVSIYRIDSQPVGSTTLGRALLGAATRDEARQLVGITVGTTPPASPEVGDLFVNTA